MIVFLSELALVISLSVGDSVEAFVLRSPLMIGPLTLVDVLVL